MAKAPPKYPISQSPSSSFKQFVRKELIGRQLPVAVSYVDKFDNQKFSVALSQYVDPLGRLINDLNEHVCLRMAITHSFNGSHVIHQQEQFAVKRPCAALYKEDDVWYRGEMVSLDDEADEIAVRFVDFGNTELIPSAHVIPLPDKFLHLPAQSLRCRFRGTSGTTAGRNSVLLQEYADGIAAELANSAGTTNPTGNVNPARITSITRIANPASAVSQTVPQSRNDPHPYSLLYHQMVAKFLAIDEDGVLVLEFVAWLNNVPRTPKNGVHTLTSVVTKTTMTTTTNMNNHNGCHNGFNGLTNVARQRKVDVVKPLADINGSHVTTFGRQTMLKTPTPLDNSGNSHSPAAPAKNGFHNGAFPITALKPTTAACLPIRGAKKRRIVAVSLPQPLTAKAYFGFGGVGCPRTRVKVGGLKALHIPANRGGYLDVCLCHLESTEKFYVQLLQHAEKVEQLKTKLTRYCADLYRQNSLCRLTPKDCESGLICVAYRQSHSTGKIAFYRCLIVDRLEEIDENESYVMVYYVDNGFAEKISTRFLFVLHELYKKLPAYAIECSLKDVPSTKRTNAKFADNIRDYKTLCIRLESINPYGTGFEVTLFDDSCSNLSMHIALSKMDGLKVRVANQI